MNTERVTMLIDGEWTEVELLTAGPPDCRDREPSPKVKPVYRTYVIRGGGPSDPRAAEGVLAWLRERE